MGVYVTGQLTRKIGLKVLEMGGSAVIGYIYYFISFYRTIKVIFRTPLDWKVFNVWRINVMK